MSNRNILVLGGLLVIAGGVLWWGMSRTQAPGPARLLPEPVSAAQALLQDEQNTAEVVRRFGEGVVYVPVGLEFTVTEGIVSPVRRNHGAVGVNWPSG
ncbi:MULTISPECIES: hypothetical protein [Thermaceae]|jgi:hypothetical protein|uniref:Uncharacterized protein n=4 Tax=Meiothermus TaxID=65551 RepID=A0A399E5P2_9DEIN|nr:MULTISPECIES: hypothetical protein [Thermaceae]AWR88157.1 hypothetical protein Mtai_v1c29380 [Meiothermus taiwanensis WR-220]KIQ53409.1 hypothetical protein SY28_14035 [Meiothermus taiwanensis]RIH77262.1 hypothetical protein Mcate_01408 [Meiothermus taiwanensis]RIH80382.1 hypothetical protein Mhypo_00509 [Meiothermus hypogaeus]GEM82575.1 hypothetical protein MHY01S_07410 [Meiothermus hypogaeus NBRC 106114]